MPARNVYHDAVVRGLIAEGWNITDDPLTISYGGKDLYVDLGAEQAAIGAERDGRKIAVEIHSFLNPSPVRDLQEAVGQYAVYRTVLSEIEPDRVLYLAVPLGAHEAFLAERFGQLIVKRNAIRLVIFDDQTGRILQWID